MTVRPLAFILLFAPLQLIPGCTIESRNEPGDSDSMASVRPTLRPGVDSAQVLVPGDVETRSDSVTRDGATLYWRPTRAARVVEAMSDSVLMQYALSVDGHLVQLQHLYSIQGIGEGFYNAGDYRSSRLLYDAGEISMSSPGDSNVLNLFKAEQQAITFRRDSSYTLVIFGGDMFCHGTGCSSSTAIIVNQTAAGVRYFQLYTEICFEERIWNLVKAEFSDGVLRIPVAEIPCGPNQRIVRWVDVDSLFNAAG